MEEDKPLNLEDIIRKFSSQPDLATGNQPQRPQRFKMSHAQEAKPMEPTLGQNFNDKFSNVKETTKKRSQTPLLKPQPKDFCFAEEKILEKSSKVKELSLAFSEQTSTERPLRKAGETQEKSFTQSKESQKISPRSGLSLSPSSENPWETSANVGLNRQLKGYNLSIMQSRIVSMFDELLKIIESDDYHANLRQCLDKASPNYITYIGMRKKDILKSDHGIVVAGETSAGKSTLINKILELRIFKGRNLESTSTICKIRNSERVVIKTELETGEVKFKDMSDVDVETQEGQKRLRDTLKNLTDMTILRGSKKYKSVDIGIPVSFLKGNTILVDTPGIGGSKKVSQKLMEYLSNAVSFIFVINVANAGGMQRDRLPEILKSIINLQMENEMPCFDPRSVIFITNKWDSIKRDLDDSSDEDEVEKSWKKIKDSINTNWPSVREENVFKLNLTDVYREESSTLEFERFRKTLEMVIKENENIRITEHFRYLCTLLENVRTGVRTRQELTNKTKEEQERTSQEHQNRIVMLKNKCRMKSNEWRKRMERFVQEQAEESFEFMSSDIGKERILNPKGLAPIMKVPYVPNTVGDEVRGRIGVYIYAKVRCPLVVGFFKDIKEEILDFYKEVSFEIEKMENEWTGNEESKKEIRYKEQSVAPYVAGMIASSPIWFPLLVAGVAIALAAIPLVAPVMAILSRDSRKKKIIDEKYEESKAIFKSNVCNALETHHVDALDKFITKITDDILNRRIKFIEETIKELSINREKIIANQKTLKHLAERIESIKIITDEIKQELYSV